MSSTNDDSDRQQEAVAPVQVTFEDVSAAAYRIRKGLKKTPCERSKLSEAVGMELYFKKEYLHITGSFKERGARNTLLLLSKEQKKKGVIAASAGNHALALSYHGRELGIPVTVVMPINAPIMKISACRKYEANVIVSGSDIIEAKDIALRLGKTNSLEYINGYDHPHILAGQGTCGLEIIEDVPDADAVVIPVGGGGLIAGMAVALKNLNPDVMVIGVEAERCASFKAAMKEKKPVKIKAIRSIADGLNVSEVGKNAFATAEPHVDRVISVREDFIELAILRLIEEEGAVVEGAGATALAAILAGHLQDLEGKKVVVLLCGRNIDFSVLARCFDRAVVVDGQLANFMVTAPDAGTGNIDSSVLARCINRGAVTDVQLVKFTVTVLNAETEIVELARLLRNANVKVMHFEKRSNGSDQIETEAEVRDEVHGEQVRKALTRQYPDIMWADGY